MPLAHELYTATVEASAAIRNLTVGETLPWASVERALKRLESLRLYLGTTGCLDAFFRTHVEKYVRLCIFHVKKAIVEHTTRKGWLRRNDALRERFLALVDELAFSAEAWQGVWARMQDEFKDHPELLVYLREEWL